MPRPGDALIAVGLFAAALFGVFLAPPASAPAVDVVDAILLAAATLPVAWRHRAPATVLWLTTLAWMAFVLTGYLTTTSLIGVAAALYSVGLYRPRRDALLNGAAALVVIAGWGLVGYVAHEPITGKAIAATGIALGVAFAIGLAENRRHSRLTELEIAHTREEQARAVAAADAVRVERARIARELHDVVAHEVTVMTLQAEGASRLARDGDPRVRDALTIISESGRTGLLEMQRMIGILRASEADAVAGPTVNGSAVAGLASVSAFDLMPMPSLAALPKLVQQVEDAGLPVLLEVSGSAHVPAGVELSAFRIVQESLTNAMKHAGPGATATVSVARESTAVTVTVEDDGRGVISEAMHSGGHGLNGMRERVTALGGTLDTGPRRGGGYRVRAVMPSSDDQVRAPHAGHEERDHP